MTPAGYALLVVGRRNLQKLEQLLISAGAALESRLYVRFNPDEPRSDETVSKIYLSAAHHCPETDVRVLVKNELPEKYHVIGEDEPERTEPLPKKYRKVVLGGTFDRLHNGHKVLLNKAAELASEDIVVGVTEKVMIEKKTLFEMIEPVELRMSRVVDFVEDVSGSIQAKCLAEPIIDPFGPSTRIEDLEAIVVSAETVKGAKAVNERREKQGMSQLDVIVVELVEANDVILKETKISSSSRRREDLGRLIRPVRDVPRQKGRPYIIGLAGGIASGKSHIGKYLKEKHGFEVIDCDKLAHVCYAKGSELNRKIEKHFGADVVADGVVDRKKLGSIVFSDESKLRELSELVWPEVKKEAMKIVEKSTAQVVVIEAAALIEAKWHEGLAETWTVFVPRPEALRRVVERDNLTEEQAESRIRLQTDNKTRIDNSNVVFCSLWEYEETRAQVDRAVQKLLQRI